MKENYNTYLLATIAEECSEIQKPVCKAIRFGLDSNYNGKTNVDEILDEFNDLVGIMELFCEENNIPFSLDKEKINKKKQKVKLYFEVAKELKSKEVNENKN